MQDAKELFYEAAQLGIRAQKAPTPAKRDALYAKLYDMLHRVLRVDPSLIEAQHNLGNMYRNGEGVQQDFKQAAAWYRKAADQGFANAQGNLGVMYHYGKGVQQDFKQAVALYQKAAGQGMAQAQYNLGKMYRQGQGVQQDFKQAAALYRKAADQGMTHAQSSLGVMYKEGQGVQQDNTQAAAWFQKAADQGDTRAYLMLAVLCEMAGDYQAAFESYRAGQVADRDLARAGMRRCLEQMADSSRKKKQDQ
jgi:TPR repeat protein